MALLDDPDNSRTSWMFRSEKLRRRKAAVTVRSGLRR
jgi:hypothetical protein